MSDYKSDSKSEREQVVRVVLDARPVMACFGCGSIPDEPTPTYECQSCGTAFNRNESADGDSARCPECNKFAAKSGNGACPHCDEPLEDGFSVDAIDGEPVLLPKGATPA